MLLYRALLHLYPSGFRAEYGDDMGAIFGKRWRTSPGALPRLAMLIGAVADIFPNALRSHTDLFRQDARYAVRSLRRSPAFTLTAVLVTALGIGATTATFSIADHVLLKPLPYPNADRLVKVWETSERGACCNEVSPGKYRDWKKLTTSIEAMAAYRPYAANLVGGGEPARVSTAVVDADFFPVLGAQPALGRLFAAADDRAGAPGAVILSDALWKKRFGGDQGVLGKQFQLDDESYTVVGVMPRGFDFPTRDTELYTPIRFDEESYVDRNDTYLQVVGKLKRTALLEEARTEIRLVASQLERAYPQKESERSSATVIRLRDEVSQQSRLLLTALFGAALGLLLIACTSLANLLLARALGRRKELAVRTAMGAGRQRLARQLMTESLVLSLGGGILGLFLAGAAVPLAARLVPTSLPIAEVPRLDLSMMLFALLLTGATGIGFGVLPALRACKDAETGALREGVRAGTGRRTERLRSALVVAEVTASVALLIGSGLLLRALWRVQSVDPGFRADGVLTMRTTLPLPKYNETAKRALFYRRVLSEIRALPGVSNAGYTSFLPMVVRGGIWGVTLDGQPREAQKSRAVGLRYVTPGYFDTMGIRRLAGRDVADSDRHDRPFVAVVSESFVKKYGLAGDPLGRRINVAFHDRTIVGIVNDVRVRGLERESEPQLYLPCEQVNDGDLSWYMPKDLVVKVASAPGPLLPAIREIVAKADPQLPVSDVRMLADIVEADTAPRSVQLSVLVSFAVAAFLLAGIGIHGLLAFTVSQRSRDIGVRMALGAQKGSILRMILQQGALLAVAGVLLGGAAAYAAGRGMQALLAGVSPADAPTFAAAIALSLGMTFLGSLAPALRAARVDPAIALRTE